MTRPLGYAAGGPIPREEPDLIDKGKIAIKGLGSKGLESLRSLFGAKEAGASESDGGGSLMDSIMNLFMMNELTKVGIDWDDDNDLVIKYIDKFGDPYDNIKKLK